MEKMLQMVYDADGDSGVVQTISVC